MRSLTSREKLLLTLCLLTLFVMGNLIGLQRVTGGLRKSGAALANLKTEEIEQRSWLAERTGQWDDPVERGRWIDANMPVMKSAGKDQGQLLEKLQTEAFDRKLRLERQNLLEPQSTQFYQEVSVNVIVRGDLAKINEWLTTLQSPETFYVVKNLELALDTNSKEKEPQARCNLTVARWFQPAGDDS